MLSAEAYYRVLGVNNGASETEIKAAYKRLAKYWHPDCNPSAEAHDTFVAINEACRYLLQVKKEKNIRMHTSQEWQKQQQARAREKAINDVRMRFEAYIRSDEYKELTAFSQVADFISAVYILLLFIGLPLGILCIYLGPKALWTAVLWVPIVFIVLEKQMGIFSFLRLQPFIQSCKKIITPRKLFGFILLLANVFVLFSVGFNTFVPIGYLVAMYLIPVVVFFLLTAVISLFYHRLLSVFHTFLWSLSLVHCLLCVNYFTATQSQQTTYSLLPKQTSTLIALEQNQLKDYPHIRLFFNDEFIFSSRQVSYTFARGGLGLPVVVEYRFSW